MKADSLADLVNMAARLRRPLRAKRNVRSRQSAIGVQAVLACAFISAAAPALRGQRPSPAISELDHAAWTIETATPHLSGFEHAVATA